ncbi:MAG: allantoinase AllB [Opitutaceae bacterium]|nr:allantoinase AllB [Opitutaceae bacterium]
MPDFDTVILRGTVVGPTGEYPMDLGIADGIIQAIEKDLSGQANHEILAEGCFVIPGIIDSHVHINEPGNTDWEGFETGSKAAAAGGTTCIIDMPINSLPTTINAEAFHKKKEHGENNCLVDFALWGGLVPDNIGQLESLWELGVIGFKAFMSNSGIKKFPCVDTTSLKKGMKAIAKLEGMVLALHAEDDALTAKLSKQYIQSGNTNYTDFLNSRPIEAELIAIKTAIELSGETGCPIHIVHVSCAEGIDLITEAKQNKVDITAETCPHYLCLTTEALDQWGAIAKCAPPLRNPFAVEALWEKFRKGEIDTLGSDHSPCLDVMKKGEDFFKAWCGISGIQHLATISYSLIREKTNWSLLDISKLLSTHPAERFQLPRKGKLEVGMDADLCVANFKGRNSISSEGLYYKNKHSPYVGLHFPFQAKETLVRGRSVFADGTIQNNGRGKFIRFRI